MYIPEEEYKIILKKMPILCVDLLIVFGKKFLLLKRNNEPAKGEYWFPGGRLYKMETIKDASIRKAKEEVNLSCNFKHIVSIEETIFEKTGAMFTDIHTVNIVCSLTTKSIAELKVDNLHDGYKWFSYSEIDELNLHVGIVNPLKIEFSRVKK